MRSPESIDETSALLASQDYVADRALATTIFLALRLGRPLFVEGEPGTGKTEIAKVLAAGLGAELIRLQCYEGLDVNAAAYEWNYARQLVEIRLAEATHESRESIARNLFSERFLIERPLLRSLLPHTHLRSKSWEYSAIYPDGRTEVILSVPKYDFNWQTEYVFAQPLKLPKGTKIVKN